MGYSSVSLRFMLVVSLSYAVSSSSSSSSFFSQRNFLSSSPFSKKASSSSSLSSSPQKACAADLLSLLGSKDQASRLNTKEAEHLRSCLKFLVPFSPNNDTKPHKCSIRRRRDLLNYDDRLRSSTNILSGRSRRVEDELIWWPPAPVLELARLAIDSGGDPGSIHRALDPTMLPVPDVEGSNENRCELTRTPYGRRFISEELNTYLAFLFDLIVARGPSVGLHVSLNRYDFFHGHLFLADDSGRLGILI